MAQKFYVDNLISKFIKCLLWDTNVPIIGVWTKEKPLIAGYSYITYDKFLVKAKQDYNPTIISAENPPKSGQDSTYFDVIGNYVDNESYRGFTTNFRSNSNLYDPDTHYYLGQYLRYLRDMHNLDLMSLYNCYSGITSDKIRFRDGTIINNNTQKDGLTVYLVPIKFNQVYTIYFNSGIPFKLYPVLYDGLSAKKLNDSISAVNVNYCSDIQPYLYNGVTLYGDGIQDKVSILNEPYLHLLIQVPSNISHLVVLEGDYIKVNCYIDSEDGNKKLTKQYFEDLTNINLNPILQSIPSLTKNTTKEDFAFSDRLLEYLLLAPIIKNDKVRYNINRVQEYLSSDNAVDVLGEKYDIPYIKDIMDNDLRVYIYDLITYKYKAPLILDINGFVDKDSEFIIEQAKTVNKNKEGRLNV